MSTVLERCRDVHSPYETTTLFIESLTPPIKPLVWQAREDQLLSSFKDTVARERSHGDAFLTQHATGRRVDFRKPRPVKQVLAALNGVPSTSTGPLPVFKRTGEPRITSLQKVTTLEGLLPPRRKNPPSIKETRYSTANGADHINPLESLPRALADLHPDDRPVITRRIFRDTFFTCYRVGDQIAPTAI